MKQILQLALVSVFISIGVNAQNLKQTNISFQKKIEYNDLHKLEKQLNEALIEKSSQDQQTNIITSNKVTAAGAIKIGKSPHIYTQLNVRSRVMDAIPELNTVSFAHRNNSNELDGTSSWYRYDYSLDGGESFTIDIGPLNEGSSHTSVPNGHARFPQGVLYAPDGMAENATLIYAGATHDNLTTDNTVWDGFVAGSSKLTDISTTTQTDYLFTQGVIPGSLTEGLPGEFWMADFEWTDLNEQGGLVVYKGEWTGSDVEWGVGFRAPNDIFDQSVNAFIGKPVVAFSDDGMTGYVLLPGGLGVDAENIGFAPLFWMTENGGQLWTGPHSMNLDKLGGYADTAAYYHNGNLGLAPEDQFSGPLSLGYEDTDIIVDKRGNLHVAGLLQSVFWSAGDFTPYSLGGGGNFVVDMIYDKTANDWSMVYPNPSTAGQAIIENYADTIIHDGNHASDVRFQLSKDAAGEKIFLTWGDDWDNLGAGDESHRDLIGFAYDIETGKTTDVRNFTVDNEDWYGKAYFFSTAPKVFESNNVYSIPTVLTDIIDPNNQLATVEFWYYQEATFEESDFVYDQAVPAGGPVAYSGILPVLGEIQCVDVTDVDFVLNLVDFDASLLWNEEVTWYFGDGSDPQTANVNTPIGHTFPEGIFNVKVCGDNKDGFVCLDKVVSTVEDFNGPDIQVYYEGDLISPNGVIDIEPTTEDLESLLEVIVTDNFDPDPEVTYVGVYDLLELGSYDIIIIATDASGNESSIIITINVLDTEAPDIFVIYEGVEYSDGAVFDVEGGEGLILSDIIDIIATDDSPIESFDIIEDIDFANAGTSYEIFVTIIDESGNEGNATFTINIVDTIAPAFDYVQNDYFTGTSINCNVDGGFETGPNDLEKLFTISDAFISDNDEVSNYIEYNNTVDETEPGIYDVTYSANDGNGNTSSLTVTFEVLPECTGLQDYLLSKAVKVSPNPSTGKFNINIEQNQSKTMLIVYNSVGEELLWRKTNITNETVDLSEQPSGIYFLQVIRNGAMTTMKLVVE